MNNHENPSLLERPDRIDDVDANLIKQCINGNRRAWDDFFSLASPFIGCAIRLILLAKGDRCNQNEEFIDMIFNQVVEELYGRRRLASLTAPAGLKPYLRQVVRSKINDWYRTNLSRKNLLKTTAEESLLELPAADRESQNPFAADHEDLLPPPLPAGDLMGAIMKRYAEQWRTVISPLDQWILRLKAIYYAPLDETEIRDLARFSRPI